MTAGGACRAVPLGGRSPRAPPASCGPSTCPTTDPTSRAGQQRGSAMGAHYRHTTPEMAARVVAAIQQRLTIALGVAELAVERQPNRSTLRVF